MATNQPIVPLGEMERIADFFEASTEIIRGEKWAVQVLPENVNRSFEDRECVREIVKSRKLSEKDLTLAST